MPDVRTTQVFPVHQPLSLGGQGPLRDKVFLLELRLRPRSVLQMARIAK